jgi:hypothetical protein
MIEGTRTNSGECNKDRQHVPNCVHQSDRVSCDNRFFTRFFTLSQNVSTTFQLLYFLNMADEDGSVKRKRDSPEEIRNLPTEASVEKQDQSVAHTELELPSNLTVSRASPLPPVSKTVACFDMIEYDFHVVLLLLLIQFFWSHLVQEFENWEQMCNALIAEAATDVQTRASCSAATTVAERTQVHRFFQFYSRYARAPAAYVAPVGIGDPTVGGVMELNFQSSASYFEFLQACNGIAWGDPAQTRFWVSAQRPGGAWSSRFQAKF